MLREIYLKMIIKGNGEITEPYYLKSSSEDLGNIRTEIDRFRVVRGVEVENIDITVISEDEYNNNRGGYVGREESLSQSRVQ